MSKNDSKFIGSRYRHGRTSAEIVEEGAATPPRRSLSTMTVSSNNIPDVKLPPSRTRSGDFSIASTQSLRHGIAPSSKNETTLSDNLSGFVVQAESKSLNHEQSIGGMMEDLKRHIDRTMSEIREQSRRDFEKVLSVLQQESLKRTALEGRLHSQLLMQSETMVAMELKLLRLEAKVERREGANRQTQSRSRAPVMFDRIEESPRPTRPPNVISSTASLASGVTANSSTLDGGEDEGPTIPHSDEDGSSTITPQRVHVAGGALESILLNPMIGEMDTGATSTRAVRGEGDGNSSLATSVTGSTFTSTVVTETTRRTHPPMVQVVDEEPVPRPARSRSQSPLTVQSSSVVGEDEAAGPSSIASERTIMTTGAVAAPRIGRSRAGFANRVVSFDVAMQPQGISEAGGDSITMPDELDNLSEVADTFASSARLWREEYEARLDALQKRWGSTE